MLAVARVPGRSLGLGGRRKTKTRRSRLRYRHLVVSLGCCCLCCLCCRRCLCCRWPAYLSRACWLSRRWPRTTGRASTVAGKLASRGVETWTIWTASMGRGPWILPKTDLPCWQHSTRGRSPVDACIKTENPPPPSSKVPEEARIRSNLPTSIVQSRPLQALQTDLCSPVRRPKRARQAQRAQRPSTHGCKAWTV